MKHILTLAFAACLSAATAAEQPNIVFIMADDLGWKDVGCQGAEFFETPNIDRLAAGGMTMQAAYSGGPARRWSRSTRPSSTRSPPTGRIKAR